MGRDHRVETPTRAPGRAEVVRQGLQEDVSGSGAAAERDASLCVSLLRAWGSALSVSRSGEIIARA